MIVRHVTNKYIHFINLGLWWYLAVLQEVFSQIIFNSPYHKQGTHCLIVIQWRIYEVKVSTLTRYTSSIET